MYTERTSVRVGVCPVRGCAGAGAGEEGRGAGGRLRRRAVGRARFHIVYRPFSLASRSQQRLFILNHYAKCVFSTRTRSPL